MTQKIAYQPKSPEWYRTRLPVDVQMPMVTADAKAFEPLLASSGDGEKARLLFGLEQNSAFTQRFELLDRDALVNGTSVAERGEENLRPFVRGQMGTTYLAFDHVRHIPTVIQYVCEENIRWAEAERIAKAFGFPLNGSSVESILVQVPILESDRERIEQGLKEIPALNEHLCKRYVNDLQIGKRLSSPNIIQSYAGNADCMDANGKPVAWLAKEYTVCSSLKKATEEKKVSPNEIPVITVGLVRAICDLADKGLVHSDIKPQNILLSDGSLSVYLHNLAVSSNFGEVPAGLDFEHASPEAFVYVRDPAYIGDRCAALKEIWLGGVRELNERSSVWREKGVPVYTASDVFSLGVTLIETYAELENDLRVLQMIRYEDALPLGVKLGMTLRDPRAFSDMTGTLLSPVPLGMRDILRSMLRADPDERPWPTELLAKLETITG